MSVHMEPHRTNNMLEGFFSDFLQLVGARPGVWHFHGQLRKMEERKFFDVERAGNHVRINRIIRQPYRRQNAAITQAQVALRDGRINVAEYLEQISHSADTLSRTLRGRRLPELQQQLPRLAMPPINQEQEPQALPQGQPPAPLLNQGQVPPQAQDRNIDQMEEVQVDVGRGRCVICLLAQASYACIPCGHVCYCHACWEAAQQNFIIYDIDVCPTCRAAVTEGVHRIYI